MTALPLRDWLGFVVGALRLPPAVFWRMTPPEFFAAVARWNADQGGEEGREGMSREDLADLMQRFPD